MIINIIIIIFFIYLQIIKKLKFLLRTKDNKHLILIYKTLNIQNNYIYNYEF